MFRLTNIILLICSGLLVFLMLGCGNKVESSKIDCELDDISISHDLKGRVSSGGDTVLGTITIKCKTDLVDGVTITGSAGWWAIGSVGPSVNGVIDVRKAAESLGHSDIGTSKTVDIIVNGKQGGSEASRKFPIAIPIS
jgi:hypothetical protein